MVAKKYCINLIMSYSKKDNSESFSYVDNLVGNALVKKNTKALNNKLSKFTKKQRKSLANKEIIKFQKKVIKKYLELLKKKEFTTKFEREILKIVEFELKKKKNQNELLLGASFRNVYFKINRIELKKKRFSKNKKLVQVYRGDLMKDYLELSRNVFRMTCCVLEKNNLKSLISLTSPREKADYNLLDILDLANLILYSLTEPIEMLRVLQELQKKHSEIRCDILHNYYDKLNEELTKILAYH